MMTLVDGVDTQLVVGDHEGVHDHVHAPHHHFGSLF